MRRYFLTTLVACAAWRRSVHAEQIESVTKQLATRALVLNLLWQRCDAVRIAQEKCAIDKAFALIEGHPKAFVSSAKVLGHPPAHT
jgi:hypothetical protein